jgi:hypothetical protein
MTPGSAANGPQKPIWAKAAIPIDGWCRQKPPASELIWAPDRQWVIEFRCEGKRDELLPHLRIRASNGNWQDLQFRKGEKTNYEYQGGDEVLWSPDSKAFFVNGNENGYTNYMLFYRLDATGWRSHEIDTRVQRDLVRQFPPCKAFNRDPVGCHDFEADPEFNIASIAWTRNGAALIVMGEIPCTSTYGGIMCAVAGYEIGLDGTILARMSAAELKSRWQHAMAWKMRIPDPPAYGRPMPGLPTHR